MDANDFVEAFPLGGGDFDFVFDAFSDHGFCHGGKDGDAVVFGIGFGGTDDGEDDFFFILDIEQGDGGPKDDAIAFDGAWVDDFGARDLIFEVFDLSSDLALAFFGVLVLGIFAEIAVGAGFFDVTDVFVFFDGFELVEFVL